MAPILPFLAGILLMLGLALVAGRFIGFRAQTSAEFADKGPTFDLRRHLDGAILCEGVVFGPLGRVSSRFVADMDVRWTGDTGVMTERFHYDTGAVQDRVWTLVLAEDGTIRASAPDVEGEGNGEARGPSVRMTYRLRLAKDAGGHLLHVTDWMYLMENGTILNRSQFTKFGFKVAELVATMRKKPA